VPQYLCCLRPARVGFYKAPTPGEIRAVDRHFLYLKEAADEGTVILAGRTLNEDKSGSGVVIFVAPSDEEARRFAEDDPAVAEGVFRMELFPYRIALSSSRWAATLDESSLSPASAEASSPAGS
jgi:uncharacterized protein YciI